MAEGRAPPVPRAGQRHAAPRLIAPDSSPNCSHRVGAGPRHRRALWRGCAGTAGTWWGLQGPPPTLLLGLRGPVPAAGTWCDAAVGAELFPGSPSRLRGVQGSPTGSAPRGWQLGISADVQRPNEINEGERGRYAARAALISAAPLGSALPHAGAAAFPAHGLGLGQDGSLACPIPGCGFWGGPELGRVTAATTATAAPGGRQPGEVGAAGGEPLSCAERLWSEGRPGAKWLSG